MTGRFPAAPCWAALLGLMAPGPARAADHTNLDENLPVTIEDAYVTPYNGIEAQGYFLYDRDRLGSRGRGNKGSDLFTFAPRVEAGLFRNFQASVALPYSLGNASETKQGNANVQGLYNFNNETLHLPALSLGGGVIQPYGYQRGGIETQVKAAATKSIGSFGTSYVPRRLHLNAIWFHNYDPLRGGNAERQDRYLVGVGYSQPVTNDAVLVADVYRQELRERGRAENMVELGTRYQLTPQTVLSSAVGTGFGDRSPAFRVLVGFQHTLSWPLLFR